MDKTKVIMKIGRNLSLLFITSIKLNNIKPEKQNSQINPEIKPSTTVDFLVLLKSSSNPLTLKIRITTRSLGGK